MTLLICTISFCFVTCLYLVSGRNSEAYSSDSSLSSRSSSELSLSLRFLTSRDWVCRGGDLSWSDFILPMIRLLWLFSLRDRDGYLFLSLDTGGLPPSSATSVASFLVAFSVALCSLIGAPAAANLSLYYSFLPLLLSP